MTMSSEKQLFDSANVYYQGATMLMQPTALAKSHLLIQPGVTCAALSLKLYLKCLLALEGKDREDSLYRIADLYLAVSEPLKKSILERFGEFSNTQPTSDDLQNHLEALDSAFVKWRYLHEEDAKSVNVDDLEEMILATKSAVLDIRPDWE